LLILGAPGAGKTTLLLMLARELLDRAERDAGHPIPVIFNLSSWAEKRLSLAAWMVDELNKQHDVPRAMAEVWIEDDQVLPLLDGLDEVHSPTAARVFCQD
jgi:predicted NACHT family NTPase